MIHLPLAELANGLGGFGAIIAIPLFILGVLYAFAPLIIMNQLGKIKKQAESQTKFSNQLLKEAETQNKLTRQLLKAYGHEPEA